MGEGVYLSGYFTVRKLAKAFVAPAVFQKNVYLEISRESPENCQKLSKKM